MTRILASAVRENLRAGDTLVVWKLDRLGRSVKQLVDLVGELQKEGVQFKSLTDSLDTGTPSGRFFFHVMASLAEMERELIVERTRAGLEVARQLGRTGGRKRLMTETRSKRQGSCSPAGFRRVMWPATWAFLSLPYIDGSPHRPPSSRPSGA